jgi:hypothetical protein
MLFLYKCILLNDRRFFYLNSPIFFKVGAVYSERMLSNTSAELSGYIMRLHFQDKAAF